MCQKFKACLVSNRVPNVHLQGVVGRPNDRHSGASLPTDIFEERAVARTCSHDMSDESANHDEPEHHLTRVEPAPIPVLEGIVGI